MFCHGRYILKRNLGYLRRKTRISRIPKESGRVLGPRVVIDESVPAPIETSWRHGTAAVRTVVALQEAL